jgi:RNA-directed DNA polymerase
MRWTNLDGGEAIVVRYADDTVVGFQHRSDAERFLDQLRQQLKKFGLELHPQKIGSSSSGASRRATARHWDLANLRPSPSSASHICGTNKGGGYLILRHTIGKRLREKIRQVKETMSRMLQ